MNYNPVRTMGNNVVVEADNMNAHYEAFETELKLLRMEEDTNFYIMTPNTTKSGIFSYTMSVINPIEKFIKQVSGTYKIKDGFDSNKVSEALNEYY